MGILVGIHKGRKGLWNDPQRSCFTKLTHKALHTRSLSFRGTHSNICAHAHTHTHTHTHTQAEYQKVEKGSV